MRYVVTIEAVTYFGEDEDSSPLGWDIHVDARDPDEARRVARDMIFLQPYAEVYDANRHGEWLGVEQEEGV